MLLALLVLATLFVAYANGANDNFKGVATLYGSGTTSFRLALAIGTIATLAGSISSVFLADALVKAFSGKGLVPDQIAGSPDFLLAVAIGAAATVMLATVVGFPISTTHALTGALVGAGFVAAGSTMNVSALGKTFFLPLLLSPLLSLLLTMPLYKLAHETVNRTGLLRESCLCIGPNQFVPVTALSVDGSGQLLSPLVGGGIGATIGTTEQCVQKYGGSYFGVHAQSVVDSIHYTSGIAVSFARGLNDTPKIVALLLVIQAFRIEISMLGIALAMAAGGILNARKVAETMSKKISRMNDGQALTANLVTAFMVIGASRLGVPVSTTHVSVGSISGVGIINGTADRSVIGAILLSWVLTLPIAAAIASMVFLMLSLKG